MKKLLLFILILVAVAGICVVTCPDKAAHSEALKDLVNTVYSHNLPTVEDGSPCDGPNSRIHSGSVSAGGEHSHSRNLCNNQLK